MSHALQQHGRDIAVGFRSVTHRQGTGCGEMVSTLNGETDTSGGLSRFEQVGLAVAVIVLLIGGAVALGGR